MHLKQSGNVAFLKCFRRTICILNFQNLIKEELNILLATKGFYNKEGYIHSTKTNKLILWLDDVNIFHET